MMSSEKPAIRYARRSRLVRYLAVAYTLLVVYASLYPFHPWRAIASSPIAFLFEPWPRYAMSDVTLNVLGYLPLGLLLTLSAMSWTSARWAAIGASIAGAAVSLSLESAQSFLPPRVPSNLDLLSNGIGAIAGAALAGTAGERWLLSGLLYRLRNQLFLPGSSVDVGFVLLVLWLFAQLYPALWLFGSGDLRSLLDLHSLQFDPASYRWIETAVTSINLAAIALFARALAQPQRNIGALLLLLVTAALALKSVTYQTVFKSPDASQWLPPGALLGIPIGVALYLMLAWAAAKRVSWCAAGMLLLGAALINIAPENPYLTASVQTWQFGHFLSFNGTTRLVSILWPFTAALYMLWWSSHSTPRRALAAVGGKTES